MIFFGIFCSTTVNCGGVTKDVGSVTEQPTILIQKYCAHLHENVKADKSVPRCNICQ